MVRPRETPGPPRWWSPTTGTSGATPQPGLLPVERLSATDNVAASGRIYYDQAYNFPTLSPIESTVAIDNGVAFFGDNAGDFYAINVSTSIPVWEDTSGSNTTTYTPSDQIIERGRHHSSAAVDPKLQINGAAEPAVIFGTEADPSGNGSVTAVNEDTGDVLWSTQTSSGVESSPALYDGQVYVATDDGTFYDSTSRPAQCSGNRSFPRTGDRRSRVLTGDRRQHVAPFGRGGRRGRRDRHEPDHRGRPVGRHDGNW